MRIVLFGATGMLGRGVLLECLADPDVSHVLSIGRRATDVQHVKLTQIVHDDFIDYSGIGEQLAGFDACFFCLGVSSVGMSEGRYRHITYDVTLAAAQALLARSQALVFCYVSAAGADISEQGRSMWARVRGKTENELLKLPFADAYMFRPAYVHPIEGLTPQLPWLRRAMYFFVRPLYPVLRVLLPRYVTTGENFGRAMITVAQHGYSSSVLESDDINAVTRRAS
jgi:uncharacterized protein YbjT (DUF2867 family)